MIIIIVLRYDYNDQMVIFYRDIRILWDLTIVNGTTRSFTDIINIYLQAHTIQFNFIKHWYQFPRLTSSLS